MAQRRISVVIDSKGANKVATELDNVNKRGNLAVSALNRVVGAIGSIGSAVWRYRYRIMAALTAVYYFADKAYTEFDYTMTMTRVALVLTTEEMEVLRLKALDLAKTTMYSANDASTAMMELGRAGFNLEEIYSSVDAVLNFAAVADIELGVAAEKTAHIIREWSMDTSEAGHVADVLAKSEQVATGSVLDLAESLKFAGLGAAAAGIPLEDTAAMLLVMANAGLQGSLAGRALRTAMIRFERIKAGYAPALAAKAFKSLGREVQNAVKQVQKGNMGFVDFISTLVHAGASGDELVSLFDVTAAGADLAGAGLGDMAAIFEQNAAPAMLALGSRANTMYEDIRQALMDSTGYSQWAADQIAASYEGLKRKIKASLGAMAITVMTTFGPTLKDILDNHLHPWINSVTEAWENGGDTWQEKLATVWETKLKPIWQQGLDSLSQMVKDAIPVVAGAMADLAGEMVIPLTVGIAKGLADLAWTALKGYGLTTYEAGKILYNNTRELLGLDMSRIPILPNMPGQAMSSADAARYGLPLPGQQQAPQYTGAALVSKLEELTVATDKNTNSLDNNTDTKGGSTTSGSGFADIFSSLFGDNIIGEGVGGLGSLLLGYVTDPIVDALDKYLAPLQTDIGNVAGAALRVFDVPMSLLHGVLEGITWLLGGKNYNEGRLTGNGSYQYAYAGAGAGGSNVSASSSVHVETLNVNGVKDGEDAANRTVQEVAAYHEINSQGNARQMKRGMVKREAMEP